MLDLTGSTTVRALRTAAVVFSILAAAVAQAASDGEASAAKPTPAQRLLASKVTCDQAIKVLSGNAKTRSGKASGEMSAIAFQVPDFVTCKAIEKNAASLCELAGGGSTCVDTFNAFSEMRAHPKGRGYLFSAQDLVYCKKQDELAPYCDKIREAAIKGDPDLCPTGVLETYCRAFIGMNEDACRALTEPEGAAEECLKQIDRRGVYAGNLESFAKSGSEKEKAFARAALGKAGACAAYEQKARDACYKLVQKRVPEVTPGLPPPTAKFDATPAANPTPQAKAADS